MSENFYDSGLVHVNEYTKDDGTHVRDYYRSRPGGGGMVMTEVPADTPEEIVIHERIERRENRKEERDSIWIGIGNFLIEAYQAALSALSYIAQLKPEEIINSGNIKNTYWKEDSSFSTARTDFSNEIQQTKSHINNLVNTAKNSISQEYNQLLKMLDDISQMPESEYKNLKIQDFNARKAEYDSANNAINRINAFNQQEMFDKIPEEFDKNVLPNITQNQAAYSPGYVTGFPVTGGGGSARYTQPPVNNLQENINRIGYEVSGIPDKYGKEAINAGLVITNPTAKNLIDNFPTMEALNSINYKMNMEKANRPLTYEMMRHSIYNLEDVRYTPDCVLIENSNNWNLGKKLHVDVPAGWKGIYYSTESNLSKKILLSKDFQKAIKDYHYSLKQGNISLTKSFYFNNDIDLLGSIHGATITNFHFDKNGNLSVIIYDQYDFAMNWDWKDELALPTNMALLLQTLYILEKYYILIQVDIPPNILGKILNEK